jgi:hypothetical protein
MFNGVELLRDVLLIKCSSIRDMFLNCPCIITYMIHFCDLTIMSDRAASGYGSVP